MKITVNGTIRDIDDETTLAQLLEAEGADARGVAAAVDGEVVPRGDWPGAVLAEGQVVEVLTAVQGG